MEREIFLIEDTRQQIHSGKDRHAAKHAWWALHGVPIIRQALDFGDYSTLHSNFCVDTKRHIQELAQCIGGKDHARFRRELQRAQAAGYRLVILTENTEGISCTADLTTWVNTHCTKCKHFYSRTNKCVPSEAVICAQHGTKPPIQGARLARSCDTMTARYHARFLFCTPDKSAQIICDLLGIPYSETPNQGLESHEST